MLHPALSTFMIAFVSILVLAAIVIRIRSYRHYRKRCVDYTAQTPTGRLIKGRYYFKSAKLKPEHEIKAEILELLNHWGWYADYVIIMHIGPGNFTFPKRGEPRITAQSASLYVGVKK